MPKNRLSGKIAKLRTGVMILAVSVFALAPNSYSDDTAASIQDKDILTYLQDVINWRHAIVDGDLSSDNARISLLKDSLKNDSRKVLKYCFDFANAESAILEETENKSSEATKTDNTRHNTLAKKIDDAKQHIDAIEGQLDDIKQKSGDSPSAGIRALREKLSGELRVEQAHLDLLNSFMVNFSSNENEDTGLSGQINKLSRSMLGDLTEQSAPATKQDTKDNTSVKDDGILEIMSDLLSLSKKKKTINTLIEQTAELSASNRKIIQLLRVPLQNAVKEGYALADAPVGQSRKSMDNHRHALAEWSEKYKKLSNAAIPLGQIISLLDAGNSTLEEWSLILEQQWNKVFRHFVMRLGILGASLVIPFIFLELAHKAILRYVRDINRMRQLNIARQIVFVTFLVLVFFLNFFTEFGSLATYAGFLTAGLAVALQTVLVSLTAHFFFFGRFGVRAGDRVTISGITGDVVQVGMLRIYLMELIGDKSGFRPSGKIVAFPNSVLFNSTAFSKQVSGTSYTWNDLAFSLDPRSDFSSVNKKIIEVVNSVYGEYKKIIERQYVALEQSTNLAVGVPTPRSEINVKDSGLVCEVHYPVIIENASKVYEQIISKLIKAFDSDTRFKLILSSPLKIVTVDEEEFLSRD